MAAESASQAADSASQVTPSNMENISAITNLSAFKQVISNEEAEKQVRVLTKLFIKTARGAGEKKICLLHNQQWLHTAKEVSNWYSDRRIPVESVSYEEVRWLENVKQSACTHFIFFGYPAHERQKRRVLRSAKSPIESSTAISAFFTPKDGGGSVGSRRVNEVVVVLGDKLSTRKDHKSRFGDHYLERYLKLHFHKESAVVAASALGIFAGPQPVPWHTDKAYWSETPKLIEDFRHGPNPLGLTIMTREMSEGAPFGKIVLINHISERYKYDFYSRVTRYTHIQSVNGIFLDGLDIEKVTKVFKDLPDHHIQLMARYIHVEDSQTSNPKRNESTRKEGMTELPCRESTYASLPKRSDTERKVEVDEAQDPIPLPLYILGDNLQLCQELFHYLTSTEASNESHYPPPARTNSMPTSMKSSPSSSSGATPVDENREFISMSGSSDDAPDMDTVPPLPRYSSSNNPSFRRQSSCLKGIAASDKYMQREEIPMKKFERLPSLPHNLSESELLSLPQTPAQTPGYGRQDSINPVPQHQFILHVPMQDLDRQMAHIYFKSSGIYLVVIGLDDLIENPLIQYENLFYWVNLIHTYISPETKRMIVVGMYSRSNINEADVLKSMDLVNKVLQQYRQAMRLPLEEQGFLFVFNRENTVPDCQYLCSCIANCLKIFQQSAYFYAKSLYMSIFKPFQSFQQIASRIALNYDRKVIETKYDMGLRYHDLFQKQNVHLPQHYYETLMAYSPACISRNCEGCLLTPSVIPDLLLCCTKLSQFDKQVFDDPSLRNLPVISANMLKWCFNQLKPDSKNFEFLLWWMEKLDIIYSIGRVGADEKLFIPYLTQRDTSDHSPYQWDQEHISTMFQDSVIIYAQFSVNLPTTVHLFHKVVAQMLHSIMKKGTQQHICFVAQHVPEAVLPLYDDDQEEFLCEVWVRYRAVQNIMEFQAVKIHNKIKFLKALEKKLSQAYLGSPYYNKAIDFNRAVSFHIPGGSISETTMNPHLYQLAQIESSMDEMNEYLVATTKLTEPGNRHITPALRRWADSDPETKVLPPDLYLSISKRLSVNDQWAQLGTKLNLYTSDELYMKKSQPSSDYGHEVLQRWRESRLTFRHLIDGLHHLRLDTFALKVEEIAAGSTPVSARTPLHSSPIVEKKLPADMFLDLARKLNAGVKWAELAGRLHLLQVSEVEELKSKSHVDKGSYVLQLWTDSNLTYQDLINGLKYIRYDRDAEQVELIVKRYLSS